jgi:Terpene cyclase DEP1
MHASKVLLLCLALLGLAIPWYFNIAYLLGGGSFAPEPFVAAVAANKLTAGITWDVYLAAAAFSVWLLTDAPGAKVRWPWLYVVLTFAVGLAFALPLYLAMRKPKA